MAWRVRGLAAVVAAAAVSLALGGAAGAGQRPAAAGPAATSPLAPPVSYHLEVAAEGRPPVRVYAEERGSGPPIVLLHGLGASSYAWRKVTPELARTHRVVSLDLKGFGRSDKPFDLDYGPRHQAALVAAFLARRGLTDVVLVGHSFGGAVALLTALDLQTRAPGRIRRLVLLDTPAYPQPFSAAVSFLRLPVLPYVALTLLPPELPMRLALDTEQANGRITLDDILAYALPFREAGARHALITTARQLVPYDAPRLVARYPSLRLPTLLIWCRDDDIVPLSTGRRLARTLPNARLEILDGCRHLAPDEAPAAVVARMRAWLGR